MSLWLVIVPFLFSILFFVYKGSGAKLLALIASLILMGITGYADSTMAGDGMMQHMVDYPWITDPMISFKLGIDGMSIILLMLSAVVLPIIILSTFDKPFSTGTNLYALIFLMIGSMNGVFMALDGLIFYIFWEMALIPIYFICAMWGGQNRINITIKFFIYTFVGSLFMLVSLIYLYLKTPVPHSFSIDALMSVALSGGEASLVFLGLFLAFAVKMPVFPFHSWQPDTYTVSPVVGSMLLSGIMLKMGTFGAVRWMMGLAPEGMVQWQMTLIVLAAIGIVYGAVIAIRQNDIKRVVAWSSMSHVGLIAAGLFTMSEAGLQGGFVQMFNHGINVVGLFLVADILEKRLKTRDITTMGGIASKAPIFALLSFIIVCGAMAVPLTNGFPGELLLLKSVFTYNAWLGAFAGLTIIFCAVYMLRIFQLVMFGGTKPSTEHFEEVNSIEGVSLGIVAFFVVILGIFPQSILDMSGSAVKSFLGFVG